MQITALVMIGSLILLLAAGGGITVVILLLNRKSDRDRCPKCDGNVSRDAHECPACGAVLARAPIKV